MPIIAIYFYKLEIEKLGKFDNYGRLIWAPQKIIQECPSQNNKTAVILALGQSNSANHADLRFESKYPSKVINYFNGLCYYASSPLLGASGVRGEFLTPRADFLIESGVYDKVIIVPVGVGDTAIRRWNMKADLGPVLSKLLNQLSQRYQITSVIWHQGERDYIDDTPEIEYKKDFVLFKTILKNSGVNAPIFIGISTRCGNPILWQKDNPIANAQLSLIDNKNVFLGINSDRDLESNDRGFLNPCHFNAIGQVKVAKQYSKAIRDFILH